MYAEKPFDLTKHFMQIFLLHIWRRFKRLKSEEVNEIAVFIAGFQVIFLATGHLFIISWNILIKIQCCFFWLCNTVDLFQIPIECVIKSGCDEFVKLNWITPYCLAIAVYKQNIIIRKFPKKYFNSSLDIKKISQSSLT